MRPYLRQTAGALVLGSIMGIVMNTGIVLPALMLGRAIDAVLAIERGEGDAATAGWAALGILGAAILVEASRVLKRWWLITANQRIRANIRADALRGVLSWPAERLHQTPVGDLMARIDGDVETLGTGIREATTEIWDTVLFSLSLIVAMLAFDWRLTLLAMLPVPAAMIVAFATGRWVRERISAARAAAARATAALQELLAGVRVLRLFGHEATAVRRYAELSAVQAETMLATQRLRSTLAPTYTVMMVAGVVVILWQGGEQVVAGLMTAGQLVAFLELYLRFVQRGFRVPQLVNSLQAGGVAYRRVRPLLATPLSVEGEPPRASFTPGYVAGLERRADLTPPAPQGNLPPLRAGDDVGAADSRAARRGWGGDVPLEGRGGEVSGGQGPVSLDLERVTFSYPGAPRPSLTDLSLVVPAGALVGVTGAVGSGKSALAKALVGLYQLADGHILVNGRPLDSLSPEQRATLIGYLPQDPWLFSGSVRENIVFGAPSLDGPQGERMLADAIRVAALEQDIAGFARGLDTPIGEGGVRVSGGQRQRISLARALLAGAPGRPGLLVLDDPFSAVDVDTEVRLVDGLLGAVGPSAPPERRATVVLCSHRLAAFTRVDLVILLEDGRVAELGTHAELLAAGGQYAHIYLAQQRIGQAGALPPATTEAAR
ncbi:MAG: ABC transporter ATP-binding protein [Chloroflexi bacterium]|nr:ABC transporter ATP-binding protein [Chloroflexota bacterium]